MNFESLYVVPKTFVLWYFAKLDLLYLNGHQVKSHPVIRANFDNIEKEAVTRTEDILKNRPRKRFRFRTPNEFFAAAIENEGIFPFMA